jgi:hypothetical protein
VGKEKYQAKCRFWLDIWLSRLPPSFPIHRVLGRERTLTFPMVMFLATKSSVFAGHCLGLPLGNVTESSGRSKYYTPPKVEQAETD